MLLLLNARGKGCKRLARRVAICLRERDRTAACARKTGAVARYEDITPTHYAIQNALGLRGCFMRALAAQGRRRDENTGGGDARARPARPFFCVSAAAFYTQQLTIAWQQRAPEHTRARSSASSRAIGRQARAPTPAHNSSELLRCRAWCGASGGAWRCSGSCCRCGTGSTVCVGGVFGGVLSWRTGGGRRGF